MCEVISARTWKITCTQRKPQGLDIWFGPVLVFIYSSPSKRALPNSTLIPRPGWFLQFIFTSDFRRTTGFLHVKLPVPIQIFSKKLYKKWALQLLFIYIIEPMILYSIFSCAPISPFSVKCNLLLGGWHAANNFLFSGWYPENNFLFAG